jgi:hypothetical protein
VRVRSRFVSHLTAGIKSIAAIRLPFCAGGTEVSVGQVLLLMLDVTDEYGNTGPQGEGLGDTHCECVAPQRRCHHSSRRTVAGMQKPHRHPASHDRAGDMSLQDVQLLPEVSSSVQAQYLGNGRTSLAVT